MIKNALGIAPACAPAGFLGLGSAVVRPEAGAGTVARPDLVRRRAGFDGSGLPTGMSPAQVTARGIAPIGVPVPQPATHGFTQNDGTTLGIPSSRRPQS